MAVSDTNGNIRQQIGEILATVRALQDQIRERQQAARDDAERMGTEMRGIRHEARNQNQVVTARLELVDREVTGLTARLNSIEELVKGIQGPVAQWIVFQSRRKAMLFILFSLLSIVWALVGFVIDHFGPIVLDVLIRKPV